MAAKRRRHRGQVSLGPAACGAQHGCDLAFALECGQPLTHRRAGRAASDESLDPLASAAESLGNQPCALRRAMKAELDIAVIESLQLQKEIRRLGLGA